MTQEEMLCIFIDSLPYNVVNKTAFLRGTLKKRTSIRPNIGYSVNLLPEMFCGKTPEELGYFGHWNFGRKESSPIRYPFFDLITNEEGRIPPKIGEIYQLDRVLHFFLRNHSQKLAAKNIPFPYQHLFWKHNQSIFGCQFTPKPFFREHSFTTAISQEIASKGRLRDKQAIKQAEKAINNQDRKIFLSLVHLDEVGHEFGVMSTNYVDYIRELEENVRNLIQKYKEIHDSPNIVVLSDHGMVNVNETVQLNVERSLGEVRKDTYEYFLDSTIIRIKCHNNHIYEIAREYIENHSGLNYVPKSVREKLGVSSDEFGDIIGVVDAGKVISPNFLGNKPPKAMHGYLPSVDEHHSVVLSNVESDLHSTSDIYPFLQRVLN